MKSPTLSQRGDCSVRRWSGPEPSLISSKRRTHDASLPPPPALVDRTRPPPSGCRCCPRNPSYPPVGRYLSLDSARRRSSGALPAFPERFPGRASTLSPRVLLALELLTHEVGASDEASVTACAPTVRSCTPVACEVPVDCPQEHCVLPETLAQFRSRIDETLMDERLAIQAAAAMEEGSSARRISSSIPFLCTGQPTRHRCHHAVQGSKKVLQLVETSRSNATTRKHAADDPSPRSTTPSQSHALLWSPVPRSRQSLCDTGAPDRKAALGVWQPPRGDRPACPQALRDAVHLCEPKRERLTTPLTVA